MAKRREVAELHVMPADGGWTVKQAGTVGVQRFRTRQQATKAAQELLRQSGGSLRVHGPNGKVVDTVTLGRDRMAAINRVEGLRLTDRMSREFAEFDRLGLSPEQRRERLRESYGQKKR